MEFRKIGTRGMILMGTALVLIIMSLLLSFKPKNAAFAGQPAVPPVVSLAPQPVVLEQHVNTMNPLDDEDVGAEKEMKDQMDRDRNQQRQIKMLKMQLEQVNLQLDNEKALTEINKLKKENAGYVKDSNPSMGTDFPSIRVIYIGGADTAKEAILSIDGTSYSVKAKDRPMADIEILGVTDQGVKIHFSAPQELTTVINYVQD